MRYRVGTKVVVRTPYSGGNFDDRDVVIISQIGDGDGDYDCYGAISPHDGLMWYLQEDEVEAYSNGERMRNASDEELADALVDLVFFTISGILKTIGIEPESILTKSLRAEAVADFLKKLKEPVDGSYEGTKT